MPKGFNDEQWRRIAELASAVASLSVVERKNFLASQSTDPVVINEVLILADKFTKAVAPQNEVGTQISHFVLTERLGFGGMGEVFAARDRALERNVAIKFLGTQFLGVPEAEQRFIREAQTASGLNHPNIVTIYEFVTSASGTAIVMELVPGHSLRKLCASPIDIQLIVDIGRQVASALAAAHAAGIVHRDIKPENIMLLPDKRVKVLDFGLARSFYDVAPLVGQSTQVTTLGGTWQYMSPEHYRRDPLTAKADIFAFGLVLNELSTGRHPFAGDSPADTLQAIAVQDPIPPRRLNSNIPRFLEDLILTMLSKDAALRPSAQEVENALAVGASRYPGVLTPLWRWGAFIAALSILLLAVVMLQTRLTSKSARPQFEQLTTLVAENRATAAALSPDGNFLAYANADGLFIRNVQGSETRPLQHPIDFAIDNIAWFRNSERLVLSGFREETNQPALWSVSIAGGTPIELRKDARLGVPSPDGAYLAFLTSDYRTISTLSLADGKVRAVVTGPLGDSFTSLLWTPEGRHLQFQRRHYSGDQDLGFVMLDRYYKRSFESADVSTGAIIAKIDNLWIQSAAALQDGRILMLRLPEIGASRSNQLWQLKLNRQTGRFSGPPEMVATPLESIGEW